MSAEKQLKWLVIEPINASGTDIAECMNIYNQYVRETNFTLEYDPLTLDGYAARVNGVLDAGYPFVVARSDDGSVAGFAYLSEFNPRIGYRFTADLSVYVKHDARHAGIGAALLSHIEVLATDLGLRNIISIITSENTVSTEFHKRHGFLHEGTLREVAVKFGRTLDVSYYRKPLTDTAGKAL